MVLDTLAVIKTLGESETVLDSYASDQFLLLARFIFDDVPRHCAGSYRQG